MDITFANGVSKMVFEPPDKKGKFLLVDTFKDFPREPTHETTVGEKTHKLYLAETCGFNNTLAELADSKLKRLFFTEDYAKKVRPINLGEAKFARYLPLKDNDTRKHQLDVALGYVEDNFYRVKKVSDGFHPVYVVEVADYRTATQSWHDFYSSNGNFMFAQVDMSYLNRTEVYYYYDDENNLRIDFYGGKTLPIYVPELLETYSVKPSIIYDPDRGLSWKEEYVEICSIQQPMIYEPERGNFYQVLPVQDFGLNECGVREIYLNGKLCENFSEQIRWSELSGKVFYEKIPADYADEFFCRLMVLRGHESSKSVYRKMENAWRYDDCMSDAELLGYPADYDGDDLHDLWDLNGY